MKKPPAKICTKKFVQYFLPRHTHTHPQYSNGNERAVLVCVSERKNCFKIDSVTERKKNYEKRANLPIVFQKEVLNNSCACACDSMCE